MRVYVCVYQRVSDGIFMYACTYPQYLPIS